MKYTICKRAKLAQYFLLLLLLSSCISYNKIGHFSSLKKIPSLSCVERVLRSNQMVKNVRSKKTNNSKTTTPNGAQAATTDYAFSYTVGGLTSKLTFYTDLSGNIKFAQGFITSKKVLQKNKKIIRPVMIEIEKTIEMQCNTKDLIKNMHRECLGVICN